MYWMFEHFTAGLWPLVWHWGTAAGIIIICLALEVGIEWFANIPFFGVLLKPFQKDLLWIALVAAAYLFSLTQGINLEKARCVAQGDVINQQIDQVVGDVLKEPAPADGKTVPPDVGQCKDC